MTPPQPLPSLLSIPVALIDPHPHNVREQVGDVEELAASIIQVGVLQPLTVQKIPGGRYQIIAGHRRLAAAKYAGVRAVPCVLRVGKSGAEALVLMLIENTQRQNLDPIERAHAFRRLIKITGSQTAAARAIGLSPTAISLSVQLLELTQEEQDQLRAKEITGQTAREIVHVRRGSKTKFTGWHLGKAHPLAAQVRLQCKHSNDRKVGDVGCGRCWEDVIRADERRRLADEPDTHIADISDLAYPDPAVEDEEQTA